MQVNLNGEIYHLDSPLTLEQFISQFDLTTEGTAIAINDNIVPKSTWCNYQLCHQDNISLFQMIAGG